MLHFAKVDHKRQTPVQIGQYNELYVHEVLPFGYQLVTDLEQTDQQVYLPDTETSGQNISQGMSVNAYIYVAKDGSLEASLKPDIPEHGTQQWLCVMGVSEFGAFCKWPLARDLLIPNKHQQSKMHEGGEYLVHVLYDDVSQRIIGSTKLHRFLSETPEHYAVGQAVDLQIFEQTPLGFKAKINQDAIGLLYTKDKQLPVQIGERLRGFVSHIREDGKIDLSTQAPGKTGRNLLEQAIIDDLLAHGGISTLTDKSPADEIFAYHQVSKAAYKRAIGALYKARKITLHGTHIALIDKETK